MAKSLLRLEARRLRKRGVSVRKIAQSLGVSKGTASLWVRDIILSVEQLEKLRQSSIKGGALGRLKGSLVQKNRRLDLIEQSTQKGIEIIQPLSQRELLIAGLALYWGEGSKKRRLVEFCNSDPTMINFLISWLKNCFGVNEEEIRCRVGINISHKERDEIVKKYWSEITGIPLDHFKTTSFKKVQNQKVYDNFNIHYGTLSVWVVKPSALHYKIVGLINGLGITGRGFSEEPSLSFGSTAPLVGTIRFV